MAVAAGAVRALTPIELRTMTDTERAQWLQAALPQHFVECPACAGAGCVACVDSGKMSKGGARAYRAFGPC